MLEYILLLTAISLSSVSAYFSIVGLTSIFPGAFYSLIIMGIVLEVGKLASVAFLHKHWSDVRFVKYYLSVIIFILMLINAMGIFGYLSKAHIDQVVINSSQTQTIEIVQSKIKIKEENIKDIDKQISLIDNALEKLTSTGRASNALQQIQYQQKTKAVLQKSKLDDQTELQKLKEQEINQDLANKRIEADFGPLKYIADAIYQNPTTSNFENVVRWLILVIIFVFDPLALVLLNAALFIFDIKKGKVTVQDVLEINNEEI